MLAFFLNDQLARQKAVVSQHTISQSVLSVISHLGFQILKKEESYEHSY